ncbi:hypothetical protein JTB14_020843 [Gonioctena quinquepunctata]|nr:hypothetical protein JTB14_020843 [Gonioctena quinquepunctata]
MIARRGSPKIMISDNGTNLRGASKELKRAIEVLNDSKKYNSPASSHMGGVWERIICTPTHLKNRTLKDELLSALFAEMEAIMNARPIVKVSGRH